LIGTPKAPVEVKPSRILSTDRSSPSLTISPLVRAGVAARKFGVGQEKEVKFSAFERLCLRKVVAMTEPPVESEG
jgi:hypothetical protein